MRTLPRLATAHAYALPASIAFEYPFATLAAILACNAAGLGLGRAIFPLSPYFTSMRSMASP